MEGPLPACCSAPHHDTHARVFCTFFGAGLPRETGQLTSQGRGYRGSKLLDIKVSGNFWLPAKAAQLAARPATSAPVLYKADNLNKQEIKVHPEGCLSCYRSTGPSNTGPLYVQDLLTFPYAWMRKHLCSHGPTLVSLS